ncbi:hypothetical protein HNQ38_001535 [Desulfovibrio intestinalis]|uniref:Uncharacterized protein n=1 Tax=Desulfovibrio intestinalis TaxID=58621 RepID=A0A7W8C0Q3_9BACT|nr:hypothetical protein [Desulfovibrio intestinalis]
MADFGAEWLYNQLKSLSVYIYKSFEGRFKYIYINVEKY